MIFNVTHDNLALEPQQWVSPVIMNESMTRGKTITGSERQGYFLCGTNIRLLGTKLGLFLPHKINGGNWLEVNLREHNKVMKNKCGRKESVEQTLAIVAAEGWGSWDSAGATPG